MGIAAEKSGIKLKIPPDDYVKSERSKSGFKKGDKKKKEPKPNLQKEWVVYLSFRFDSERKFDCSRDIWRLRDNWKVINSTVTCAFNNVKRRYTSKIKTWVTWLPSSQRARSYSRGVHVLGNNWTGQNWNTWFSDFFSIIISAPHVMETKRYNQRITDLQRTVDSLLVSARWARFIFHRKCGSSNCRVLARIKIQL